MIGSKLFQTPHVLRFHVPCLTSTVTLTSVYQRSAQLLLGPSDLLPRLTSVSAISRSCYFRETTGCRYAAAVHGTPGTTARKSIWSERQPSIGLAHVASRRGVAPFALSAELLLFFLQPDERVRRDLAVVKAILGWASLPRPVLAVYVLGDGVRHDGALRG